MLAKFLNYYIMAKVPTFNATIVSVMKDFKQKEVTSSTEVGVKYTQTRQLATGLVSGLSNKEEFSPKIVTVFETAFKGLKVLCSKTIVGLQQFKDGTEKDPVKVNDEVLLYHRKVLNPTNNTFMNFFEVGVESGVSNETLNERLDNAAAEVGLSAEELAEYQAILGI